MPLSADDIQRAFTALSDELERRGRHAEIVVVGGAALVLLFHARESMVGNQTIRAGSSA